MLTGLRSNFALILTVGAALSGCSANPTGTPTTTASTSPNTVATVPSTPTDTSTEGTEDPTTDQTHPDVLEVELIRADDTWTVAVTISSPYDSPERYADAFRVLAPDGTELGVRELLHDHAAEQPFTRTLTDVEIPDDITAVTVEGRDVANGWGGTTVTVDVPR